MFRKFFVFSLLILLISCSQNLPQLNTVVSTAVFDYADEDQMPEVRMGIYIDVSSDVHRVESIRCVSKSNDFEWQCDNPVKVISGTGKNKKQYAGYPNFVMPFNETFPLGQYVIYYTDLSGNEESVVMNISFDTEYASMTGKEAVQAFETNIRNLKEHWAVYDENNILIYMDEKGIIFSSFDEIWATLKNADVIRKIMVQNNGRQMYILPPVERENKKNGNENE